MDRHPDGGPEAAQLPSQPAAPSRTLALDVGNRRIGLALSDPLGITAQPLFTLERTSLRADLKSIARVIRRHAVTEIVVGDPVHLSGDPSPQSLKTRAFADALRELLPDTPIHLLDERLTTSEAHALLDRTRPRHGHARAIRQQREAIIDQVAAVLLLESFLSIRSPRLLPPPPDL